MSWPLDTFYKPVYGHVYLGSPLYTGVLKENLVLIRELQKKFPELSMKTVADNDRLPTEKYILILWKTTPMLSYNVIGKQYSGKEKVWCLLNGRNEIADDFLVGLIGELEFVKNELLRTWMSSGLTRHTRQEKRKKKEYERLTLLISKCLEKKGEQ